MELFTLSAIYGRFSEWMVHRLFLDGFSNNFQRLECKGLVRESKKANVTQIVTTTAHISINMIHLAECIDPSS